MNTLEMPLKEGEKRPSMRKAINDKCKECIYDPIGGFGNWRQQVQDCTSPGCPLYPLRPTSKPDKRDRSSSRGAKKEVSLETENSST